MFVRKLLMSLVCLVLVLGFVSEAKADISNAAVLFLRIQPNARAASMGMANVAIADDAFATQNNPAGLGAYPLSSNWHEAKLPDFYISSGIRDFAALRKSSGGDYQSFELWALTGNGLVRYDNRNWHVGEEFRTRTDQTIVSIVKSYFGIDDPERILEISARVAAMNNQRTLQEVEDVRTKIVSALPDDYSLKESMIAMLDTLVASYDLCLINWDRFGEIEKQLKDKFKVLDSLKKGALTERELDRINFAVERSRNRFIPEKITIPYSLLYSGEASSIIATGKDLIIGTDNGLVVYNGRRWKVYTAEQGLPSNQVTALQNVSGRAVIGTDKGIVRFEGNRFATLGDSSVSLNGKVTAIGGDLLSNIWAVIDNDLYHFDGENWTNSFSYKVEVDDTPERLAEKFSLYGTEAENKAFLAKITPLNNEYLASNKTTVVEPTDVGVSLTDSAKVDTTVAETTADSVVAEVSTEVAPVATTEIKFDLATSLEPGNTIRIPYTSGIKGEVSSMLVDLHGNVWLGTEYGIWSFDKRSWSAPGYVELTVDSGQTLEDIATLRQGTAGLDTEQYIKTLREINDLGNSEVVVGDKIRAYKNPAAQPVADVARQGDAICFATSSGLIKFKDGIWQREHVPGINDGLVGIETDGDEIWYMGNSRITTRANGRKQFGLTSAKWLPELADDLYYGYLSAVFGVSGIGTVGVSVPGITYGSIIQTSAANIELGKFEAYDIAFAGSYGTSLTNKLRAGLTLKLVHSRLAPVGAGAEIGTGTSWGFAGDIGLLYEWSSRLKLGTTISNIGPKMAYIDAAQADPLPSNLALGFSYKILNSEYYHFLVTSEINKLLVGLNDGFDEFKTQNGLIINSGVEFSYTGLFAARAGYIYDEEGDIRAFTVGAGIRPIDAFRFDFAYIPSSDNLVLGNTLITSIVIEF